MPDAPLCVQCRKRPATPDWRPFCSERCKTIDLGRWLSGDYRVAAEPHEEAGDDDADLATDAAASPKPLKKR